MKGCKYINDLHYVLKNKHLTCEYEWKSDWSVRSLTRMWSKFYLLISNVHSSIKMTKNKKILTPQNLRRNTYKTEKRAVTRYNCVSMYYIHTCGIILRIVCLKLNILWHYCTVDNCDYTVAGEKAIASSSVTILLLYYFWKLVNF